MQITPLKRNKTSQTNTRRFCQVSKSTTASINNLLAVGNPIESENLSVSRSALHTSPEFDQNYDSKESSASKEPSQEFSKESSKETSKEFSSEEVSMSGRRQDRGQRDLYSNIRIVRETSKLNVTSSRNETGLSESDIISRRILGDSFLMHNSTGIDNNWQLNITAKPKMKWGHLW